MQNPPGSKRPALSTEDRNFDDLAPRFARNVYGGLKGQLRLAVLERDLHQHLGARLQATPPLRVLDAGGGQGQFGLSLAPTHSVTLCDISAQMLALARQSAAEQGLDSVQFEHASIQQMARREDLQQGFDLVLCHAVLEWVVEQEALLDQLYQLVKPGGHLSITFYNRHGLVMKNLLRGAVPPLALEHFRPHRGSLTPTRPLDPQQVLNWFAARPWTLLAHSGIRVFHDYQLTPESRNMDPKTLLALELELSQQEPYRSLGRYQHLLLKKV